MIDQFTQNAIIYIVIVIIILIIIYSLLKKENLYGNKYMVSGTMGGTLPTPLAAQAIGEWW